MTFKASIITLYPDMFPGPLGMSLAGNALEKGTWSLETCHLRDFGTGKHKNVDDTPSGGGAGMVLKPDVLANAIDSVSPESDTRPRLLMSPRGKPLTQDQVREFAKGDGVVIVCGRFEGVDERVIEARNLQEVSIGDYILSGGEPAAHILLDAIVRLLPGVMGNDQSGTHESFENGLLEHPHYTRPAEFEGRALPEVLTSGNHGAVGKWQHEQSLKITRERRPDLTECAVQIAGLHQKSIFRELLNSYLDEMFEIQKLTPQEIEALGPYPYFDLYWSEANRFAYLIYKGQQPIGFAFILSEQANQVTEFYIKPEFRRLNFGAEAAASVLTHHRGNWAVNVLKINTIATKFWRSTITNLTNSQFDCNIMETNQDLLQFTFAS